MNYRIVVSILCSFVFLACNEVEPRRPVQNKSGSFYEESIERNKRVLAQEEALIKSIISKDSIHQYFESKNGFWYFYENQVDTLGVRAATDDEVILTYNLMQLKGDTIYNSEEFGVQQLKVDKTQLFQGLRNGLKVMREGEKVTFLFPSSQAFGYKGDNNKIGPNVPIKSSLELIKILKPVDSTTQLNK